MAARDTATWQIGKYLLILLVAVIPILLFALPLFLVVARSLATPENYVKFFTSKIYLKSLRNSIFIALASTVVIAPIGLIIVTMTRKYERVKRLVKLITSLPLVFSSYVFCIALIYIYGRTGIMSYLLSAVGLSFPISDLLYSTTGIIFANVLFFLPYFITPLFSSFEEIDPFLEEAAHILGSHGFHTFRTVVFPQVIYGFLTGALTTFLLVFNQISVVLALGAGRTYTLNYLLFAQYEGFQFGMANTIATVSIVTTLLVAVTVQLGLKRVWRSK